MMKFINLILFAGMIIMNYLANALPLNNKTTGQLSDSFPNLFVPAGITFSIWGVIYLLLAGYCITQFTGRNQLIISKINWLFAATCILNALWIVSWHYQKLPVSLLIMVGLLVCLVNINIVIAELPLGIIKASFGLYLGWICIATIANVTALLVNYNWNGFGIPEVLWTIIMISAGAFIVIITIIRLKNPLVGLSVVWAFIGIAIKRQDDYHSIFITSIIALSIVGIILTWTLMRNYFSDLT